MKLLDFTVHAMIFNMRDMYHSIENMFPHIFHTSISRKCKKFSVLSSFSCSSSLLVSCYNVKFTRYNVSTCPLLVDRHMMTITTMTTLTMIFYRVKRHNPVLPYLSPIGICLSESYYIFSRQEYCASYT